MRRTKGRTQLRGFDADEGTGRIVSSQQPDNSHGARGKSSLNGNHKKGYGRQYAAFGLKDGDVILSLGPRNVLKFPS